MKIAKLLMALIVASIFVVPALSMQDHGKEKDGCYNENACKVCHKLVAIEKCGCHGPEMGPATDNAREQFCKLCMKSMMPHDGCGCEKPMKPNDGCGCEKSMMPHDGCGCEKLSMGCEGWGGKGCDCEKSMMGCDGKEKQDCGCEKSMMGCDGKEKQDCGCGKSMMGCDGKEKQDCGCEESMMDCDGKDYEDGGSGLKIYFEGQDNQMPMAGDDLN